MNGDALAVRRRSDCMKMIRDLDSSVKVYYNKLFACPTMSGDQLKAFISALKADVGLQDKLKAAVEGEVDTADETAAVLAIAREAGFAFTAADLLRNKAQNILELTDDELDSIAGGRYINCMSNTFYSSLSFDSGCTTVNIHFENGGKRLRNG